MSWIFVENKTGEYLMIRPEELELLGTEWTEVEE